MILCLLIGFLYASRPAVLNFKDYVVAYSPSEEKYDDIKNYMTENEFPFLDINIDKTPDVKTYFKNTYKDKKTRVYYYGNYLGLFEDFKKIGDIRRERKEREKIRSENIQKTKKIKIKTLLKKGIYIYTNDPDFAEAKTKN